jgi:hypothetical protein
MIIKRTMLYAVAVATAAMAFMVPTAGAEPSRLPEVSTEKNVTQNCGPTFDRYSDGRWTFTKARFCLRTDTNNIWPALEFSECQYYWGLAWYSANSKYQCSFNFHHRITRNNRLLLNDSSWGSDGYNGVIQGRSTPCAGTGIYTLEARYLLTGPYYDSSRIDSGVLASNLYLPCH